jgi:integrase
VQRFLTALRPSVAAATVVKVHGVLRVALSDAERMDLVPRNAAKAAKPPSVGRSERRALSPVEARKLLDPLDGDRLGPLFVLALATGLRRGELLGLRWADVDLPGRVLVVRQTLQRTVNRRFEQLRNATGLPWLHLHDLRHAFATFLLDQGEELRTVMELLGHSTIRLTADTYGHVLPTRARNAASALDRILGEGSE